MALVKLGVPVLAVLRFEPSKMETLDWLWMTALRVWSYCSRRNLTLKQYLRSLLGH